MGMVLGVCLSMILVLGLVVSHLGGKTFVMWGGYLSRGTGLRKGLEGKWGGG